MNIPQPIEIEIFGQTSIIRGDYPRKAVEDATSFPVEGAQFSTAYKKKLWDGRKHLMQRSTGAFPTGLLSYVLEACAGREVTLVDRRMDPGCMDLYPSPTRSFDLVGISMTGKYDYQLEACKTAVEKTRGVLKIATNGGKSEIAAAIMSYLRLPSLFVVTTRELLYQARKRFLKRIPGATEESVGLIGDGIWEPGTWITVATLDTLESRLNTQVCRDFLKGIDVLFIDEAHHAGSETWYNVFSMCDAYYRFGLSGTPMDRTDGANLRLVAATGDIIFDVPNKLLVERGISAPAKIVFDKITQPVLDKKLQYKSAYKQGVVENPELTSRIVAWTKCFMKNNLSVLILVDEIAQGKNIDDALWTEAGESFIPHQFINGEEDTAIRQQALDDFGSRKLPVLIASSILDEGVDVPTIDALVLAGSRKSKIKTLQRIGRGLRGEKLIVIEFANFTNKYLLEHSLQRLKDYKDEDCFTVKQSGPSEELIAKLWNS